MGGTLESLTSFIILSSVSEYLERGREGKQRGGEINVDKRERERRYILTHTTVIVITLTIMTIRGVTSIITITCS